MNQFTSSFDHYSYGLFPFHKIDAGVSLEDFWFHIQKSFELHAVLSVSDLGLDSRSL